jgi:hypothetical protein
VGSRLDHKPELFFVLRQVDQTELISSATSGAVSRPRAATAKRLNDDKLADVFGIDVVDEPRAPRRSSPPSRASTSRRPPRRKA